MARKTSPVNSTLKSASENLAELVVDGLTDLKGQDIVVLDMRSIPHAVCDFFVLCSGTSGKHVGGLADSVELKVRKVKGDEPWHVEGYQQGDWILMDYVDVVVHIFRPEVREFYGIQKLWADAPARSIA